MQAWESGRMSHAVVEKNGIMEDPLGVMGYWFFYHREGQPVGGVCMWARTDSPATLHSSTITAPTNQQNI